MRRSKSIRLTLLPWLALAALTQTEIACAAVRRGDTTSAGTDVSPRRDPDDCFADRKDDDDCDGPARRIAASNPDGGGASPTTDGATSDADDDAESENGPRPVPVTSGPSAPGTTIFRGGFGHYFFGGGG